MAHLVSLPPPPKTPLGRVRILSKHAGIRVSPLVLGGMSIGQAWADGMGSMSKKDSFALLDAYYDAGGNFIDTANVYQDGESETWIGEWMKERGNRDEIVISTKFTSHYLAHRLEKTSHLANYSGNSRRSLHVSLRDSLAKLQTDYVDILFVHYWDWTTSIEELMDSLHNVVQQGKVLYLGASDTPAWVVAAANEYALARGKTPFAVYQGQWHVGLRDNERDILPMCRHYGMAICPWGAMGSGKFQSRKQMDARKAGGESFRTFLGAPELTPEQVKLSEALCKVTEEHGLESPTTIALAYLMNKAPRIFPLIGGRKVEHLHENLRAIDLRLTPEQMSYLEEQTAFDPGWLVGAVGQDPATRDSYGPFLRAMAPFAWAKEEGLAEAWD